MKIHAKVVFVLSFMVAFFASAADFTLAKVPACLEDWQNPEFYVEDGVPGAGDTVYFPKSTEVVVKDDAMAFLSQLRLLKLYDAIDSHIHLLQLLMLVGIIH